MESFFIILYFFLFLFFLIMTIYVYTHDEETHQQQPRRKKHIKRYSTYTPNYQNHHFRHYTNIQDEDEPTNFIDTASHSSSEYNDTFQDEEYEEYWNDEEDEDERL